MAKLYEHNGESKTLSEWAEVTGLKLRTIQSRLGYGWSIERALTEGAKLSRPRPMSHPWKRMTNLARENSIKLQRMPSEL